MNSKTDGFALTAFTLLVLFLFWPLIFANEIVGYRDAIQFYWPMWEWTENVWSQGEIPLWNPFDGLGRSFIADGVSAVFYPGKLIFLFRCWSIETRMGIYLAGHVWLAGLGAARFARSMRATSWGSSLAMFSYGLSGPVLFQVTNATFLVGAAWLPWGMIAIADLNRKFSPRQPTMVAALAALMVLGGDVQMAYHLLLIACVVWAWPPKDATWFCKSTRLRWLAALFAGLLTIGLSAVQFAPLFVAARASERANIPVVVNVWKLPTVGERRLGVLDDPEFQSPHGDIYEFSQPPWTLAGLVCPNFFGRPFPVRTDWASGLPSAGASWQPSLFQGLIPVACAFGAWRLRRVRWLVGIAIIFGIGAWGWYGPVWFANELGLASGLWSPITKIGRPVGGIYWGMVTFLPGYDLFRYPAKLWIVTSLCVSVLAAIGLPRALSKQRLSVVLGVVASAALASLMATWAFDLRKWFPSDVGDEWFGPLDLDGAVEIIRSSLLQAVLVSSIAVLLARRCQKPKKFSPLWGIRGGRFAVAALVILSVIDLTLANGWLVPAIQRPPRAKATTGLEEQDKSASNHNAPAAWGEFSSRYRLEEIAEWQSESSFPRLNLLNRERLIEAPGTLQEASWTELLEALAATNPELHTIFAESDLREVKGPWLIIGPSIEPKQNTDNSIQTRVRRFLQGTINIQMPDWFNDKVLGGPRIVPVSPSSFSKTNQSPRLEVQLPQDGVLVLQDRYSPGWGARIEAIENGDKEVRYQDCIDVGGVFRGLVLAAGKYRIEFVYQPPDVFWGCLISCICWGLLGLCGLIWGLRGPIVNRP